MNIELRNFREEDVPAVLDLQEKAFPYLAEENFTWKKVHLLSHLKVFPEGQFCAVLGHVIVGSASSLIVDLGPDSYRIHTWRGVTDDGFFTNHNAKADSLYGADVCTHPRYRRIGIATRLYDARKLLAVKLNLRRIIAGGRLYNYCEYSSKLTPEEYIRRVENGSMRDPVLSFQHKNGFCFIKVLPHYMPDKRSHNFACFIEWLNSKYRRPIGDS